jgi:hypothetical protein
VPSSAETPREAVVRTILALERSCLSADGALVEHRWKDVTAAFATQSRLTEELAELLKRTPELAPERDAKVAQRIAGILVYREDQLRRLEAYRDEVGRRLASIGKVRELARTMRRHSAAASFVDSKQ